MGYELVNLFLLNQHHSEGVLTWTPETFYEITKNLAIAQKFLFLMIFLKSGKIPIETIQITFFYAKY